MKRLLSREGVLRFELRHELMFGFNPGSYWAPIGMAHSGQYYQKPDRFLRLI